MHALGDQREVASEVRYEEEEEAAEASRLQAQAAAIAAAAAHNSELQLFGIRSPVHAVASLPDYLSLPGLQEEVEEVRGSGIGREDRISGGENIYQACPKGCGLVYISLCQSAVPVRPPINGMPGPQARTPGRSTFTFARYGLTVT